MFFQRFEEVVLAVEVPGQPLMPLLSYQRRIEKLTAHELGDLTMVKVEHGATGRGVLGEVRRQVEAEPGPDRDGNALGIVGQLMTGLGGNMFEELLVIGVLIEDFQNFPLR